MLLEMALRNQNTSLHLGTYQILHGAVGNNHISMRLLNIELEL